MTQPKHAIVTGGNRGIGRRVTERLVQRGFSVDVLCQSGKSAPLDGTRTYRVDVGDYGATRALVSELGCPDVLVNNAGFMNKKTALDYDETEILRILHVNLITAVRLSAEIGAEMAARGQGRVIALGSVAGTIGHPDVWYGVSKAGLMNAMRGLARTFGSSGVSFTSVAPGPVETEMQLVNDEARKARLKAATITNRFATVDDVAELVVWLATDAPDYLNGEIFDLNNGANFR